MITDLDPPTAPVSPVQLIFAVTPLDLDLSSPGFVQRPACGYALAETFTWEIPSGAPITQTGDYTLRTTSNTASDRNNYTVKLIDSANYAGTGVTYSNEVSFSITVTDPCLTTTLTDFTIPNVSIEAGLTDTFSFIEVTDSAATAVTNPTICGARTYTVTELVAGVSTAQTIVTFNNDASGAAHTLVTVTMDENTDVGIHNMQLVVSLPDATYPTLVKTFTVTILTPVCQCSLLTWDLPSSESFSTTVKKIPSDAFTIAMSTVNVASKSASPKIRACYIPSGPSCSEVTTITSMVEYDTNADPMVFPSYFTRSGNVVTINAVDNT